MNTNREWFHVASAGFLAVLDSVTAARLDEPGLGVWTVRDLIGHTSRAYSTVENYVGAATPGQAATLPDAPAYFRAAAAAGLDPDDITERGRAAGRDLGEDPVSAARTLAARATGVVDGASDDLVVPTIVGTMRLGCYLGTRAFELTVHGLDLAAALAVEPPSSLSDAAEAAVVFTARLPQGSHAVTLLRALTGRSALPPGYSALGL